MWAPTDETEQRVTRLALLIFGGSLLLAAGTTYLIGGVPLVELRFPEIVGASLLCAFFAIIGLKIHDSWSSKEN